MNEQEWILSSFREYYDKWEDEVEDLDSFSGVIKVEKRKYKAILERYWKGAPPFTLEREPMGMTGSPKNIWFNGPNGQRNDLAQIIDIKPDDLMSVVELVDRTVLYNVNEAGTYTIQETWEVTSQREEQWDEDGQVWTEVNPAPAE